MTATAEMLGRVQRRWLKTDAGRAWRQEQRRLRLERSWRGESPPQYDVARDLRVFVLKGDGLTFAVVGREIGVSATRARELYWRAYKWLSRLGWVRSRSYTDGTMVVHPLVYTATLEELASGPGPAALAMAEADEWRRAYAG